LDPKEAEVDFDSGEESEGENEDDVLDEDPFEDDPFANIPPKAENREHSNPNSFSWCLMRYACLRLAQSSLEKFVNVAGIELTGKLTYSTIDLVSHALTSNDCYNGNKLRLSIK
jgi:hypothetical protein